MSSDCAIGIDLGTNFVCVGAFINGTVRIIPNEHDKRLTPAYVAFTEEERLFGESAKHQGPLNLDNTLYNVKRLIGRKKDNGTQNRNNETWGFLIKTDDKNRFCIQVSYTKNQTKIEETLYPEQVSAMILGRLKKMAEDHLGTKVNKAVISVPASFDDDQRAATYDAGKIAGFEVIELINEPTAAAIAYCFDNEVKKKKRIFIVDLGGGFLDISIAVVGNNDIQILTSDGDPNIGGEMVDNNIFTHYIKKFKEQNIDWSESKKKEIRLKEACEKIKRNLSAATRARIPEDLAADLGVESSSLILTRSDFNQLNESLFEKFKSLVEKVTKSDANAKKQIDDIVLVGGSTRITEIRKILLEYFNVKELNRTINPDEAVAFGAAIHAARLTYAPKIRRYTIHEVNINDCGKVNNKEGIERMIDKNKEFDEYDETIKKLSNTRNSLENTAYSVKLAIKLSDLSDKETKLNECDEALKWLEGNKHTNVKDCEEKEKYLKSLTLKINIPNKRKGKKTIAPGTEDVADKQHSDVTEEDSKQKIKEATKIIKVIADDKKIAAENKDEKRSSKSKNEGEVPKPISPRNHDGTNQPDTNVAGAENESKPKKKKNKYWGCFSFGRTSNNNSGTTNSPTTSTADIPIEQSEQSVENGGKKENESKKNEQPKTTSSDINNSTLMVKTTETTQSEVTSFIASRENDVSNKNDPVAGQAEKNLNEEVLENGIDKDGETITVQHVTEEIKQTQL